MKLRITNLTVQDVRFPTVCKTANHSVAYVTLHTNNPQLKGYGLTFIPENDTACIAAIDAIKHTLVGKDLTDITSHMADFWRQFVNQPDKDTHCSTTSIVNAVWDLWARRENKPLWRLIVDMSPEELAHCLDFTALADAITFEESLDILRANAASRSKRIVRLLERGYPASVISAHAAKKPTSEYCHNRVMFKQLLAGDAIDFGQIVGGVNEILLVLLMAAKFNIPVSPHAGGVGSCGYAQHLAMVDYIYISGSLENRVLEYVDYLHEHFSAPVMIKDGYYQVPLMPGYSVELKESSLLQYNYPYGEAWKSR